MCEVMMAMLLIYTYVTYTDAVHVYILQRTFYNGTDNSAQRS